MSVVSIIEKRQGQADVVRLFLEKFPDQLLPYVNNLLSIAQEKAEENVVKVLLESSLNKESKLDEILVNIKNQNEVKESKNQDETKYFFRAN